MNTATTATRTLVAVSRVGTTFVAKCKYDEPTHEWFRSIGLRWNKEHLAWTCQASATAAIRLTGTAPQFVWAEVSPEVKAMAHAARTELDFTQPELRKLDGRPNQCGAYNFAMDRQSALWPLKMGSGKSKPTVELVGNTGAQKTLILCPTSVRGVWRREFAKWGVVDHEILVLDNKGWSVQRQAEESQHFLRLCEARGIPAVVVQNYESACWGRGGKMPWGDWALRQKWDVVACDESHRIGKPNTKISKFCDRLRPAARKRLCLSGTPLSHSPLDIFGQARFLAPEVFGVSWAQFRNRYAKTGHFGADHIVGLINQEELADLMGSFTYQVQDEDLGLPPIQHIDRYGVMPAAARKVYDQLEKKLCVAVSDGVLTAANGLVKLLRLQQMTSGFIQLDDEDEIREFDTTKADMLSDLLEDITEPFVVFCKFRRDLDIVQAVSERMKKRYGEISSRRKDLTPQATMPDDIDLMAVQIQSGGVGIDLTRACYGAYFSIGFSLSDFDQSVCRLYRPGQTRPVTFWHLLIEDTIDDAIYDAIDKRREFVDAVIGRLKGDA